MFSDDIIEADVVTVVGDSSSVFSAVASIVLGDMVAVADTSAVRGSSISLVFLAAAVGGKSFMTA